MLSGDHHHYHQHHLLSTNNQQIQIAPTETTVYTLKLQRNFCSPFSYDFGSSTLIFQMQTNKFSHIYCDSVIFFNTLISTEFAINTFIKKNNFHVWWFTSIKLYPRTSRLVVLNQICVTSFCEFFSLLYMFAFEGAERATKLNRLATRRKTERFFFSEIESLFDEHLIGDIHMKFVFT